MSRRAQPRRAGNRWPAFSHAVRSLLARTARGDYGGGCAARAIVWYTKIAEAFQQEAREASNQRPVLQHVLAGDREQAAELLRQEVERQKADDRSYWSPLKNELNLLRHRPGQPKPPSLA